MVGEGGDSAAKRGSLRFEIGTRVECQTGEAWAPGVIVGRYYREPDWPEGQVAPYQIQLDNGALIYAPADLDECIRAESSQEAAGVERTGSDVIVVGAGAAGIGVAFSLTHTFGLDPSRVVLLERGEAVGASFRSWPAEMRFISPSFNQQGWTSSFDLNSIAHGTSPAYSLHTEHPSGKEYADYLTVCANAYDLNVRTATEVVSIEPKGKPGGPPLFHVTTRPSKPADQEGGQEGATESATETLSARYVVWAAGEFQYPDQDPDELPGAELCVHNSRVESWARLPGDDFVVIGGYESGADAAVNLAKAGRSSFNPSPSPSPNPNPDTDTDRLQRRHRLQARILSNPNPNP